MRFPKTVKLEVFEDDNGIIGFKPANLNISDDIQYTAAYSARLFAHDMIEHINGPHNIGSVSDELQALGAILFTRRDYSETDIIPALANDVFSVFEDWSNNCFETLQKGNPHPTEADYDIETILRGAEKQIRKYTYAENEYIVDYLQHALQLMRIGYSKAAHLYGDSENAYNIFQAVEHAFNTVKEYAIEESFIGCQFKLTFGLRLNGVAFATIESPFI